KPDGCYSPPSFLNVNCENPHRTVYFRFPPPISRNRSVIYPRKSKRTSHSPPLEACEKSGFRPKNRVKRQAPARGFADRVPETITCSGDGMEGSPSISRSEEHTSEL